MGEFNADKGKIHLRPLCERDAEGMLEWMHDPTINCFYCFDGQSATLESARNFIMQAQKSESDRHYAVVDETDEYFGTVSLKNIDKWNKKAEYAIAVRKKYHGAGVSKCATDEILKIAFEELKLNRVYLNVLEENGRANGFYKKYGFVFEGASREDVYIGGRMHSLAWYSILRQEFLNKG